MFPGFPPTDLKRWIAENRHLFQPPFRTAKLLAHYREFVVMVLHGPNQRFDFHGEPGEEFFLQIYGDIELHLKPDGGRRDIVTIREGEIFLCPGGIAHSPRRGAGTWGLVVERKRKPGEHDEFLWFCENCDEMVLSRVLAEGDAAPQVAAIYRSFNDDEAMRTCRNCGFVFPLAPVAERLAFL